MSHPSNRWSQIATLALVLACATPAYAQSKDPNHPAPLRAGVNTGNVDSIDGDHYYYFFAGPGKFTVVMTFKEMGVFGNPFRQHLDIDFWDDAPKLLSHNRLVSQGKEDRTEIGGNLDKRQRLRVAVAAQKGGLIRLGGHYSIQVTGAAEFGAGGKAAAVKPVDTSLYRQVGPLVGKPVTLYKPVGPLVAGSGPLYTPGGPLYKPVEVRKTEQGLRVVMAGDVLFDFDKASIRPDAAATLSQVADTIKQYGSGGVRIEGHTDAKGDEAYNLTLSQQRAASVKDWLVSNAGLAGAGFRTEGYGEARPIAPNATPDGRDDPAGRQRNRRVELLISK